MNADYSKAKLTFGWTPVFQDRRFKQGLQETINWFSSKENLKNINQMIIIYDRSQDNYQSVIEAIRNVGGKKVVSS